MKKQLIAFIFFCSTVHAKEYKVFFGNLHSHTSYSDGSGTPEEAYKYARDVAGLDFLAITEHNHKDSENSAGDRMDGVLIANNPTLYNGSGANSLISAAKRFTKNGKFVAIYGQEYSSISKGNHVNVFEIGEVIPTANGDFSGLLNWLGTHKDSLKKLALIQFNHPKEHDGADEYGMDDFSSQDKWIEAMGKQTALIEVLNGPGMSQEAGRRPAKEMEDDYFHYLNLGFKLAPTADQDNHYKTWGTVTDARTGVLASSLTKKAIMQALKARRAYASYDKNLKVRFRLNGKIMGSALKLASGINKVSAKIKIEDPDEPQASYKVEILHDKVGGAEIAVPIASKDLTGNGTIEFKDLLYGGENEYYLVQITQESPGQAKDKAWTSPVWIQKH